MPVRALLATLLGRGSRLYPFEAAAVEQVIARLSEESGTRLRKQVQSINKIQRLSAGKEVNLYKIRHGKPAFDNALRFTSTEEESLLATVNLVDPGGGKARLKVELWMVGGWLFSLLFNKPPKEFFVGSHIHTVQPTIADVKIWFDPMLLDNVVQQETSTSLRGWLAAWEKDGKVSELQVPLIADKRKAVLERIDAALPADYLELLSQTDGLTVGAYVIHGAGKVRKIVTEGFNYYVLAETSYCGLVVQEGSADGEVGLLNYEDDSLRPIARPMGKSLKDAIEIVLNTPSN
jgi:hypothetical protein